MKKNNRVISKIIFRVYNDSTKDLVALLPELGIIYYSWFEHNKIDHITYLDIVNKTRLALPEEYEEFLRILKTITDYNLVVYKKYTHKNRLLRKTLTT